jgi:hypothetical protein
LISPVLEKSTSFFTRKEFHLLTNNLTISKNCKIILIISLKHKVTSLLIQEMTINIALFN